jgi:hypothetical protein
MEEFNLDERNNCEIYGCGRLEELEHKLAEWGSLSLKRKRCWLRFIHNKIYITLHCMLKGPPSPQLYMRE